MMRYALIAALAGCLALGGLAWWQSGRIARLEDRKAALTLLHDACAARVRNILKDKESDDEIDRIPDDGLRTGRPEWMLPPAGAGRGR